jgi:hypothetical protein
MKDSSGSWTGFDRSKLTLLGYSALQQSSINLFIDLQQNAPHFEVEYLSFLIKKGEILECLLFHQGGKEEAAQFLAVIRIDQNCQRRSFEICMFPEQLVGSGIEFIDGQTVAPDYDANILGVFEIRAELNTIDCKSAELIP